MIAGGSTCTTPGCPTSVAELYDNGSFYYFSYPTSNMIVSRWDQTATMLTNGEVLFAGGYDSCTSSCVSGGTTELFNPLGDSFASGQALSTDRSGHTATLLTDGSVLLVGGINGGVTLSSTDSYQPSGLALPQLASITIAPSNQPMVLGTTLLLTATGADAYGDNLGMLQSVIWNYLAQRCHYQQCGRNCGHCQLASCGNDHNYGFGRDYKYWDASDRNRAPGLNHAIAFKPHG